MKEVKVWILMGNINFISELLASNWTNCLRSSKQLFIRLRANHRLNIVVICVEVSHGTENQTLLKSQDKNLF